MAVKKSIKASIIDFNLATYVEICSELGRRLKTHRLLKRVKQQDLAVRSGVSLGTIKNLESKGQCSIETFVKVATALDLTESLATLFEIKIQSIAQMEQLESIRSSRIPKRIR